MPRGIDDAVRGYQLPDSAPGRPYLSQYNLASNAPVYLTAGAPGSASGGRPSIQTVDSHYDCIVRNYMDQAAAESWTQTDGGIPAPGGR